MLIIPVPTTGSTASGHQLACSVIPTAVVHNIHHSDHLHFQPSPRSGPSSSTY
ncbi:predicted protein [Plenodomus lingam JN3]|uniref:Predicted protein n=1 Tax=Leptosphaeria maculans (strain JN3 / isolate v23.1.3 / race Av1-4-5-6-7-8) TaxID=985895 RepID=E4ZHX0_LEPMJ|nr:predicted protein [Plenodomus lingam JN3]CBX90953.1 predicted protein [Plenodomus lingam JN3]